MSELIASIHVLSGLAVADQSEKALGSRANVSWIRVQSNTHTDTHTRMSHPGINQTLNTCRRATEKAATASKPGPTRGEGGAPST